MKRNACQKCVFAVRDDNPHCGLRGFRSDFNVERCSAENDTVPNGYELQEDGYFSWVDKKKEYPKTYEECLKILTTDDDAYTYISDPSSTITQLLICRDAYMKIAGEEMGLGKPWNRFKAKVGYGIFNWKGKIHYSTTTQCILTFPTEEMRDAFYENFKELIEQCKELL